MTSTLDGGHLLLNLTIYALVYTLSVTSGHRRHFYAAFPPFVFGFPSILAYLNLAVVRPAFAVGFSGVAMAFIGYLPFTLAVDIEVNFDVSPASAVAPALFCLSLALLSVLNIRSVVAGDGTLLLGASGLILATLVSALLHAVVAYDRGESFHTRLSAAVGAPGYFESLVVSFLLMMALPFVAVPADLVTPDSVLNRYVHLLGYAPGVIVTDATTATATQFVVETPLSVGARRREKSAVATAGRYCRWRR